MQPIEQALKDLQALHEQLMQAPAPEIAPQAFLPFPPGSDPVAYAMEEVARLRQMVSMAQSQGGGTATGPTWVPGASVWAGDTGVTFVVELPGVEREELSLTIQHGELVLRGQRRPHEPDAGQRPVVMEQAMGAFERRFSLPVWCTPESVSARYEQGVLEISVSRTTGEVPGEVCVEID